MRRKHASNILVINLSHSPSLPIQCRRNHRITLASWMLSLLFNALILYLFTLLPQRYPETIDDALQVDTVTMPTERFPKTRVTPRSRFTRSSQPIKVTPPKQRSTPPSTLPLVTYARPAERVPREPVLTSLDEAIPIEGNQGCH